MSAVKPLGSSADIQRRLKDGFLGRGRYAFSIMKKRLIPLGLLILLTIGCAGSGGTSTPSPFAGSWDGTWTGGGEVGTASPTITTGGSVAGEVTNATQGWTGSIQGTISNSGSFSGSVTYNGIGTFAASGTLALSNGDQTLTGTVIIDGTASQFNLNKL